MGDVHPRNWSCVSTDSSVCTSVTVKGQSIDLVTAIVDGESQSSKEVMNYIP